MSSINRAVRLATIPSRNPGTTPPGSGSSSTVRRIAARAGGFSERRRGSLLVGQRTMELMATEQPGSKAPKFALFVIQKFKAYGYFIADHDWQAILICFLISMLGFGKVLTTPYVLLSEKSFYSLSIRKFFVLK